MQSVTDLSSKPNNINYLEAAGVINLLCPLLTDVPSIQHMAVIALGKLANHDAKLAHTILKRNILSQLLKNIDKQNVSTSVIIGCTFLYTIIYIYIFFKHILLVYD